MRVNHSKPSHSPYHCKVRQRTITAHERRYFLIIIQVFSLSPLSPYVVRVSTLTQGFPVTRRDISQRGFFLPDRFHPLHFSNPAVPVIHKPRKCRHAGSQDEEYRQHKINRGFPRIAGHLTPHCTHGLISRCNHLIQRIDGRFLLRQSRLFEFFFR